MKTRMKTWKLVLITTVVTIPCLFGLAGAAHAAAAPQANTAKGVNLWNLTQAKQP